MKSELEPPNDTVINTTPTGEAPKSRIASIEAARAIYDDCLLDAEWAARSRARIRGLVDGNPPYNPEELKRLGQSWRTNVNFREAEAIIDTNAAVLWEMNQDLFVLARFVPKDRTTGYSPDNGTDYGAIIAEEYTNVLRSWPDWPVFMDLVIHDSLESGMGAAVWPDDMQWMPKWFNISNFVFPKNTRCSRESLDLFFLRDEIDLGQLYRIVESEDKAASMGWDVEQVKRVLIRLFAAGESNTSGEPDSLFQMSPWESVQQMMKNNDSGIQRRQLEGVRVVRMYVRELEPGAGVTQYIFEEDDVRTAASAQTRGEHGESVEDPDAFLFKKQGQYENMMQCLWWLLYGYGDGFIRSVKGLGHRITPHCELSNRFIGQTFDAGVLSSSLVLQPKTGADSQKLQILRVGPVTYIPEFTEAVNTSFSPRIDALVMLRSMSTSILNNNTGVYKTKNENPLQKESDKTAKQVMSEESKEARFEKNQAAFFYAQWDYFHAEAARRLMNSKYAKTSLPVEGKEAAAEFRKRCVARGVPEEVLDYNLWGVVAERAVGTGAPGMRLDVTQQLLQIKGMMPEENQAHAVREFIAARVGAQHVDRFMPLKPKDVYASDSASIATLENNDFAEGRWIPVGSDQLHGVHLRTHFVPLVQVQQVLAEAPDRLDPRQAYGMFANALPHIQQHLAFMSKDHLPQDTARENKMKEYVKLFKQMTEVMTNLELTVKNLEKQDQQKQVQVQKQMQQMQEELQRKNVEVEKYKIDQDAALERYKADQLNSARSSKTQTSIQVAVQRAMQDMLTKQRMTEAQIASLMAKTQADVAAKTAKTAEVRLQGKPGGAE